MSPSWIWSDEITNERVARVGYNHFISNKGSWNNCFSKFSNRVLPPIYISTILQSVRKENWAHYFPYDVKLGLLAHSRSFLANQKARNAIVGAENLLNNIFEAWLLSLPPLPSRQVNMADSCECIFHLFERHHCKSRIFERMENFQNDCCRPWTKNPFKNSYSRQLRIVNTMVWPPVSQIDWPKSVFPQTKATQSFWDNDDNCGWSQQR